MRQLSRYSPAGGRNPDPKSSSPDRPGAVAGAAHRPARHGGARLFASEARSARRSEHAPDLRAMRVLRALAGHRRRPAARTTRSPTRTRLHPAGRHSLGRLPPHLSGVSFPRASSRPSDAVTAWRRSRRHVRWLEEDDSMTSFKPIAALLAFAWTMLPASGQAADDVASLRAELQALKNEYTARVGALEARIEQLESAPVAHGRGADAADGATGAGAGIGKCGVGIQSRHFAHPGRHIHRYLTRSGGLAYRRLHPERRRSRSWRAKLQSWRVRAGAELPMSIRTFRRR